MPFQVVTKAQPLSIPGRWQHQPNHSHNWHQWFVPLGKYLLEYPLQRWVIRRGLEPVCHWALTQRHVCRVESLTIVVEEPDFWWWPYSIPFDLTGISLALPMNEWALQPGFCFLGSLGLRKSLSPPQQGSLMPSPAHALSQCLPRVFPTPFTPHSPSRWPIGKL